MRTRIKNSAPCKDRLQRAADLRVVAVEDGIEVFLVMLLICDNHKLRQNALKFY
jgi:hypothetical protein